MSNFIDVSTLEYDCRKLAIKTIKENGNAMELKDFPFYLTHYSNYDEGVVRTIKVNKVSIEYSEDIQCDELFMYGTTENGTDVRVSEYEDIINLYGFDLYKSVDKQQYKLL